MPPLSMPASTKRRLQLWLLLVLLLALCSGILVYLHFRAPMPDVIILPLEEAKSSPLQLLIERGWSWVLFHLPGRRHSILLRVKILQLQRPLRPTDLPLPRPVANASRLQVWTLTQKELATLNQQLQHIPEATVIGGPSIQILTGMSGSVCAGSTVVVNGKPEFSGVELSTYPKLRKDFLELTSAIKITEPVTNQAKQVFVKTNLAARTRARLSRVGGLLLLGTPTNDKPMAVLLSSAVQ